MARIADLSGQSTAQLGQRFASQLADPAKFAAELNRQYTFLPEATARRDFELTALVARAPGARDPARGRRVFAAAGCFACHTCNGEGGALGPDLTAAAARLAPRDLLEAIVEPSREISDQYGTSEIALRDGRRLSGRIINYTEQGLVLAENLFDPAQGVRLKESDIASITPAQSPRQPACTAASESLPHAARPVGPFLRRRNRRPPRLPRRLARTLTRRGAAPPQNEYVVVNFTSRGATRS